jgi:hypothetical protein
MPELRPIDIVPVTVYFNEGTDYEFLAYHGPELKNVYGSNDGREIEETYHAIRGSHLFSDGENIKYIQTPPGKRGSQTLIKERESDKLVGGKDMLSNGFTTELWILPGFSTGLSYFSFELHGWTGNNWGAGKYTSMNFELQKENYLWSHSLTVGGTAVFSSGISFAGWAHIAVCIDSTFVKFYLNGNLVMSDSLNKTKFRDIMLTKTFLLDFNVVDHIAKTYPLDENGNRGPEESPFQSITQPTMIRSIRFTTENLYPEEFEPPLFMEI